LQAFCAGGDVVSVAKSGKGGSDGGAFARDFFREEYTLDHMLVSGQLFTALVLPHGFELADTPPTPPTIVIVAATAGVFVQALRRVHGRDYNGWRSGAFDASTLQVGKKRTKQACHPLAR